MSKTWLKYRFLLFFYFMHVLARFLPIKTYIKFAQYSLMDFIKKKKSKFFLILALGGSFWPPNYPFPSVFYFFQQYSVFLTIPVFLVDLKAHIEIALYEYMKEALKNKFFFLPFGLNWPHEVILSPKITRFWRILAFMAIFKLFIIYTF